MRTDRKYDELRRVVLTPDYIDYPEGAVLVEMGKTRVLCAVTVEERIPRWQQETGNGWVTAEYAMLPRSTQQRTSRERYKVRGRTQEIQRLIGRSLRAAVNLSELGERTFLVDCDVIQADGGTRTAAITGGYVALAMAMNKLIRTGEIAESALTAAVAAVSVGVVGDEALLDLCYDEDVQAEVDFNVVMNAEGKFIEVQGTAEGAAFLRTQLDELLDLASKGIADLLARQQEVLDLYLS